MEGYVVSYTVGDVAVPADRVLDVRARMKHRVPLNNFSVTLYFPPTCDSNAKDTSPSDASIPREQGGHALLPRIAVDGATTPYSMPSSPSSRFLALSYAHTCAEDVVYAARDALMDSNAPPAASVKSAAVTSHGSYRLAMRVSALGSESLDVDGDGLECSDGHAMDSFTPVLKQYTGRSRGWKPSPRRAASFSDASTALRVADVYLRHHTFSGADEPVQVKSSREAPVAPPDRSVAHGGMWEKPPLPELNDGDEGQEEEGDERTRNAAALFAAHALPPFHLLDNLNGSGEEEGEDSMSAGPRHEFKFGVEVDDSDDGSGHASAVTAAHVWKVQVGGPVVDAGVCACAAPPVAQASSSCHNPRMRSRLALFTPDSISASLILSCNAHAVDAPPGDLEPGSHVAYLHAFSGVPVAPDEAAHTYVEWSVQRSPAAYAHARSNGGVSLQGARLAVGVAPRSSRSCVGTCGHSIGLHSDGITLAGGVAAPVAAGRYGVGDVVGMCVQWLHMHDAPWGEAAMAAIVVFNVNGRVVGSVGPMCVPQGVDLYAAASIASPGLRLRLRLSADECVHVSHRVCVHSLQYPHGHARIVALDGSELMRAGGEAAALSSLSGVTLSDDAYGAEQFGTAAGAVNKHESALQARAWRDARTFA